MERRIFLPLCIIFLLISSFVYPAYADVITQFDGTPIPGVTTLLNNLGIPNVPASETVAEFFTVPGTGTITYRVEVDGGAFFYSFGFCDASAVSADPITQKQLYAVQCIGSGSEIFDDTTANPGATSVQSVTAGDVLIFWLIPNNDRSVFLTNPSSFFPSQTSNNALRSPLFSVSNANPGQFDQVLSFVGGGKTAFTWEDLTRAGPTDNSFIDLGFSINIALTPINDPCDGIDNNGNNIIDEGTLGVNDDGDGFTDEAGDGCPPPPPNGGGGGNGDSLTIGGEILPLDNTALLVAGIQNSSVWIISALVLVASAVFGTIYFRPKLH